MRVIFDSDTLPRRMAKQLKRAADSSGIALKLTRAQYTIARLHGYRDWIELMAILSDPEPFAPGKDAIPGDKESYEQELISGLSELLGVEAEVARSLFGSFERLADMARRPMPPRDAVVIRGARRRAPSNGKRFFNLSRS